MSATGCGRCWKGFLGPAAETGALVACPTCKPHVLPYLEKWGRAEPQRVLYVPPSDAPMVPMPEWFRDRLRGTRGLRTVGAA